MKDCNSLKKSKIVVIGIPVLLIGGTEIQTLTVVKALILGGYHVVVCCYHEYVQEMVEKFEVAGAHVKLLRLKRASNIWGLINVCMCLQKIFRTLHADVLHVQYIAPGLIPIIAAKLARVTNILATVHIAGTAVYGAKAKLMLRMSAKICSAFICVSKGVEEFWFGSSMLFDKKNFSKNRKHYTIYNAVDMANNFKISKEEAEVLRQSLNLHKRQVIGIVGRLSVQKGHTILLDSLVDIKQKFPNAKLLVIGDGLEREALQLKAEKLGLTDTILWLGSKSQKELYKYYQIMDILVMPSLYEGFGLAAAEAMAFGVPVIGSNVAGLSEVIEHENSGLLFNACDSDSLEIALCRLLADPQMRLQYGVYGQQRVASCFSMMAFVNQMISFYDNFII
jgi:glycosyltransferase involved in cell wall biosynthesis